MLQDRMEWKISVERVHTQKKMAAAHKSRAPHTTNKKGPQKKIKSNEIDDRSGTYSQRYGLLMFNGTCFFCASAPFSFFSFSFFCFLLKYYFTTATMDDAGRTLFFFWQGSNVVMGLFFSSSSSTPRREYLLWRYLFFLNSSFFLGWSVATFRPAIVVCWWPTAGQYPPSIGRSHSSIFIGHKWTLSSPTLLPSPFIFFFLPFCFVCVCVCVCVCVFLFIRSDLFFFISFALVFSFRFRKRTPLG